MNHPEPQSISFPILMSDIEKGLIKIPQFQRDFVWTKEKSARLLDSILKGVSDRYFHSMENEGDPSFRAKPRGGYVTRYSRGRLCPSRS